MCQFKSGIITKNDVLWLLDDESHEKIIEVNGLNDKTNEPDFVRVEMLPVDGDIFNHKPENWKLHVDQDFRPEWFSEKEAEELMRGPLQKTFDQRFFLQGLTQEIKDGVNYVGGSATINYVYGSATINSVYGSATIDSVYGSATINNVYDSATINSVSGSATINNVYDSAIIKVYSSAAKWHLEENGIAIIQYESNPRIVVANPRIKLEIQK